MTEPGKKALPMRHCFNCGVELAPSPFRERFPSCGSPACEREARAEMQQEREEAHERLDRDMGWDE